MSIETTLGNFFKAEVRASGRKLLAEEKISITGGSDTTIQVYVRASPPIKVLLTSGGIENETFTAVCTCPARKKTQFCKHVWGALLGAEGKFPDFLSAKRNIEKTDLLSESGTGEEESYAATAKIRASEYRKEQYQKQKAHVKSKKQERGARESARGLDSFPPEIATLLGYFTQNGFPMPSGPSEEIISEAKRKLSRVFHPDKGGSHAEIIELNESCEKLMRFLAGWNPSA